MTEATCAVFIVSTTGDGDPPDSMKVESMHPICANFENFWKVLLNKRIPPDFLDELSFAVLGLGDTKYDK